MGTISRLASNAARYAGQASRAGAAQALAASRRGEAIGVAAARETARINSYTEPSDVLGAVDTGGGTAKITVDDHKRFYPVQGGIDVPDVDLAAIADVAGLANATLYYPYYDDVTLADTAPIVQVTTDPKVAQAGYAAGRHPLGAITTPAGGAAATTGSGGTRPPSSGEQLP